MKRVLGLTVVGALLILTVAGYAHAARTHKAPLACSLPRDARMVAADAEAQLYTRPERLGPRGGVIWPEAFGCTFRNKHTYSLGELELGGTPEGSKGIELETLGGAMAAYEYSLAAPEFKESLVVVRSLITGRILHHVPSGPSMRPNRVGAGPLTTLVVKGDGAVAWIVETHIGLSLPSNNYQTRNEYAVYALDETGTRQLAVGDNIDPQSLDLVSSTLYWTQGGQAFSAVLN